jgi:hypothetical protein
MPKCQTCGNEYEKAFTVILDNKSHVFDSFECAIHELAPVCGHCGCKILGHGMEAQGTMYCCAHCAKKAGHGELRDAV